MAVINKTRDSKNKIRSDGKESIHCINEYNNNVEIVKILIMLHI